MATITIRVDEKVKKEGNSGKVRKNLYKKNRDRNIKKEESGKIYM